jgi:hypothetical protein
MCGFAAATTSTPTFAELSVNRCQHEPWEQAALAELRAGNVATAVAAYLSHDRVLVTGDRQHMVTAAIDRWHDAHTTGRHIVLLGGTNELVDVLNDAARNRLIDTGELPTGIDGHYANRPYRIGERIVLRRNSDRARTLDASHVTVANGHTGTLTHVGAGELTILLDHDLTTVTVDGDYLADGGRVEHAYAITTTRSQGGTWDQAITVGLDGLYREAAYVDLSRGRHSNLLIITAPEAEHIDILARDPLERHDHSGIPLPSEQPGRLDEELTNDLERSRAKHLAHTIDPNIAIVAALATQPFAWLEARHAHCANTERLANEIVGVDLHELHAAFERAEHTATHASIGGTVKALDRHNIGTITGVDDTAGTILVTFTSNDGRTAERALPWHELAILDTHPLQRVLPDVAQHRLNQLRNATDTTTTEWVRRVADNDVEPGETGRTLQAIRRRIEQATEHLAAEQPQWLTALIGVQPDTPTGRETWTTAARHIATWQLQHRTAGPGLHPPEGADNGWVQLNARLVDTRAWLDQHRQTEIPQLQHRSHSELIQRRIELDKILDTAPADQHRLINRLRRGDPRLLNDAAEVLKSALDGQGARQHWILEHWPHIIEHAEVTSAIYRQAWGPDRTSAAEGCRVLELGAEADRQQVSLDGGL